MERVLFGTRSTWVSSRRGITARSKRGLAALVSSTRAYVRSEVLSRCVLCGEFLFDYNVRDGSGGEGCN